MNSTKRRLLLAMLTTAAISLVMAGLFISAISEDLVLFIVIWGACLTCACLVIILAVVDMRAVRKKYRRRQGELDNQLAEFIDEAREKKPNGE